MFSFLPGFPNEPSHESPRPPDARDPRPGGRPVGHGVGAERDAAVAPAAHAARRLGPAPRRRRRTNEAAPAAALRRHAPPHEPFAVSDYEFAVNYYEYLLHSGPARFLHRESKCPV